MMTRLIGFGLAGLLLLTADQAAAQQAQLQSMTLAQNLGNLLASEGFCGLSFDQTAVAAFIDKRVAADDMQFNPMLTMMTEGSKVQLSELSPSGKTAHCAQSVRVARSFGFVR